MLHDEEEDTGPSVESADPDERIQARRTRIQKRIEQLKREALGDDAALVQEVKEEIGKGSEQVEESRKRLTKLISDGTDLVTNVRVALNAREAIHRTSDTASTQARIQKLEAEVKTSQEKFDEITKRWTAASMKEIPHDLHDMLTEQTSSCNAVRDEKNKLINDLQMELKQKDDEYVKDLKRQAEDVDLMIERMEEQIKNLTKSYRDELTQIEKAFEEQRREKLGSDNKRWDNLMQQKRDKEEEYMNLRESRVEEHERQLDHLRTHDAEEYNMVKIKLETDVQILEQQLQQMKATYQLNQEKLEYNFQVLKKRDEENTITKSQQKRKITRLQDILNNLRLKLGKQERSYKDENQNLVDDYKRIAEQYKELHKKMYHFSSTDSKKFHDIWCMNEDKVRELVDKVLKIDKIMHEQQLGLPWTQPDLSFMSHHGPIMKHTVEKESNALTIAKEILTSVQKPGASESDKGDVKTSSNLKLTPYTVKQVLEILCDEAGFLVEEKLNKLLQPLENEERSLIKLDAIFKALNIESEEDINKLANFFYQHRIPKKESQSDYAEEIDEPDSLLHPNEILKILKEFVSEHVKPHKDKHRTSHDQSLDSSKPRDVDKDVAFWNNMCNVVSDQKMRMWDAFIHSVDKYHSVLKERDVRIKETDALRQQNAELRMLLHQYITSKVNEELEIPPTRVLQLEYS